jgi:hypothetical protein
VHRPRAAQQTMARQAKISGVFDSGMRAKRNSHCGSIEE